MKLIVGLGNLGKKYEGTRHNAGFMMLDKMICQKDLAPVGECIVFNKDSKFDSEIAEAHYKGEKLIFIKPQTYMNLSGQAVQKIISFYKVDITDLIIISDDLDLPLGTWKLQLGKGPKDHGGINDIEEKLCSKDFWRVRVGVDNRKPEPHFAKATDGKDYVLQDFTAEEKNILNKTIDEICKRLK